MQTEHDKYLGLITAKNTYGISVYIPKANGENDFLLGRMNCTPAPAPGMESCELVYRPLLVMDNVIIWEPSIPNIRIKQTGFLTEEKLVQFLTLKIIQDYPKVAKILQRYVKEKKLRKKIQKKLSEVYAAKAKEGDIEVITELPEWWAKRQEEDVQPDHSVLPGRWIIYHRRKWMGNMWDDGYLELSDSNQQEPHLAGDYVNAARYIFLKTQEPLNEIAITSPAEIGGWKAVEYPSDTTPKYAIVDDKKHWIGNYDASTMTLSHNVGGAGKNGPWAKIEGQQFPDVQKALEYLFTHTQEPLNEGKTKTSNLNAFTLGKTEGDMVVFNKLNYAALLQKKYGIPKSRLFNDSGTKEIYFSYDETNYCWAIFDRALNNGKGYVVGKLWENNILEYVPSLNLQFTITDENFTGSLENAARYIWLKRQKPLKEGKSKWFKQDAMYPKFPIEADGIEGWYYQKWNEQHKKDMHQYSIADADGNLLGVWHPDDGSLTYMKKGAFPVNKFTEKYEDYNDGPFENVHKAAAYIWLSRQENRSWLKRTIHNIISEDHAHIPKHPKKIIDLSEFPDWEAIRREDDMEPEFNSWIIVTKIRDKHGYGQVIGMVYDDGDIVWMTGKETVYHNGVPTWSSVREHGQTQFIDNPSQFARYIWLQRQKPLNEMKYKKVKKLNVGIVGTIVVFPEVNYWKAKIIFISPNKSKIWEIHDDAGLYRGVFNEQTGVLSNMHDSDGNPVVADEATSYAGKVDINKAVQFMYLKMQKPLNEDKTSLIKHFGGIPIQGLDGWSYAYEFSSAKNGLMYIYDDTNTNVGIFQSKEGRVSYRPNGPVGIENETEGPFDNVEQAARFIWLKRQKPISWLKRTINKIVSEENV